jgi:hypothetical protein
MSVAPASQHEQIREFVVELSGFARTAEATLKTIEDAPEANTGLFSVFSEMMVAIRGTAQQLELPHIAELAALAEELSIKGRTSDSRPRIRKCVGALWDALTTIKHLLEHFDEETGEEQKILVNRLESTLKAFGGAREMISVDEIEALLKQRG